MGDSGKFSGEKDELVRGTDKETEKNKNKKTYVFGDEPLFEFDGFVEDKDNGSAKTDDGFMSISEYLRNERTGTTAADIREPVYNKNDELEIEETLAHADKIAMREGEMPDDISTGNASRNITNPETAAEYTLGAEHTFRHETSGENQFHDDGKVKKEQHRQFFDQSSDESEEHTEAYSGVEVYQGSDNESDDGEMYSDIEKAQESGHESNSDEKHQGSGDGLRSDNELYSDIRKYQSDKETQVGGLSENKESDSDLLSDMKTREIHSETASEKNKIEGESVKENTGTEDFFDKRKNVNYDYFFASESTKYPDTSEIFDTKPDVQEFDQVHFDELIKSGLGGEDSEFGDIWDDEGRETWEKEERIIKKVAEIELPELTESLDDSLDMSEVFEDGTTSGYRYEGGIRPKVMGNEFKIGVESREQYRQRTSKLYEERRSARYADMHSKLGAIQKRLLYSFIFTLIVFMFENVNLFFGGAPDQLLMHEKSFIFALSQLVLMLAGVFISWDIFEAAFKNLRKKALTVEMLAVAVMVAAVVYHFIITAMTAPSNPQGMVLLGTPAMLVVFLCNVYRYFNLRCMFKSFDMTCDFGEYLTFVKLASGAAVPDYSAYEGYISKKASLLCINEIPRIDETYKDKTHGDTYFGINKYILIFMIFGSALFGVITGLKNGSFLSGVHYTYLMFMFMAPVSVFTALFLPRYLAIKYAEDEGGTITDFGTGSEVCKENIIMISDTELFPSHNLTIMKYDVKKSENIEKHLSHIAGLFGEMGGTLSGVFKKMEKGLSVCDDVRIIEIDEYGISARVDDSIVRAGSLAYLVRYGIDIPEDTTEYAPNVRTLYIADNKVFCAKIVMSYKADINLCKKIASFRWDNIVFSLKTCNPCIDRALVLITTGLEPEMLKLVKYKSGDEIIPQSTDREGRLVSSKGVGGLFAALRAYLTQRKRIKKSLVMVFSLMSIGILLGILAATFSVKTGFLSIFLLSYQIVSCALTAVYISLSERH